MNANTHLRSAVRQCQFCAVRSFSSTGARQQVQPESPRFINIPEPPQQKAPERPVVKGFLPPPRALFGGKLDYEDALVKQLRAVTVGNYKPTGAKPGSRAEWQTSVARQRRRNLLEGTLELRQRKMQSLESRQRCSKEKRERREKALRKAISQDEMLTMQSNNFDVKQLMSGAFARVDSTELLKQKQANHESRLKTKHEERMMNLHSLYVKAQGFIVSNEQLDTAIEKAFGTDEKPVYFFNEMVDKPEDAHSVWAYGKPDMVQDKIYRATKQARSRAMDAGSGTLQAQSKLERIDRIAERLTGGELGKNPADQQSM